MSEVVRVPPEVSGSLDAVELLANCAVVRYRTKNNVVIGCKDRGRRHPCRIMASYEQGIFTVSVPETGFAVSIRIDETMAVLKEAADASREAEQMLQEERDYAQDCAAPQR